jgi:hypothetical protein
MPGIPQSATFSFGGSWGYVTGISVETPTAEVTNMTDASTAKGFLVMVPTGDWSGGTISVDYLHHGTFDVQAVVGNVGPLVFTSSTYSVARRAILVSASTEARVGEVVRGSLRFQVTDYQGS